jgi:hypothetical protein
MPHYQGLIPGVNKFGPREPTEEEIQARAIKFGKTIAADIEREVRRRRMAVMRAKVRCTKVTRHETGGETLEFSAVGKSGSYSADGLDEDNTFAKFTPTATFTMYVSNEALHGKFNPGQKFYVDFTEAS